MNLAETRTIPVALRACASEVSVRHQNTGIARNPFGRKPVTET